MPVWLVRYSYTRFIPSDPLCNFFFALERANVEKTNINFWIYLFFIKDEEAFPKLQQFYRPMVYAILNRQNIHKTAYLINQSDLISAADTVLLRCLYYFRVREKRGFSSFFQQALRNEFKDLYKRHTRYRPPEGQIQIHLDSMLKEDTPRYMADSISFQKDPTHQIVMNALEKEWMCDHIGDYLKPFQKKIFDLRLKGYRRVEICKMLKISSQRYDYTMRKIRRVLERLDS